MHRASLLAALALLGVLASPVSAGGRPEIIPLEPGALDAAALEGTCDFPVELVDRSTNAKLMAFPPRSDGSQLTRVTGVVRSTLTNLDSGASIELAANARMEFDARPDGSTVVDSSGRAFLSVYEGDERSRFRPGLYLVVGHYQATFGEDGFVLGPERVTGRVLDLCEALG